MSPWLLYTVNMIKLHANLLQTAFSDIYSTYCALVYFSRHVLFRHIFQDSFHHFLTNGWSAANGCRQNKRSHSFQKNKSIFKIWSPKSIITLISCLDAHSDGTHSLQSIHWWESDAMLHFSKSDEEKNSSASRMTWGWAHFNSFEFLGELFL